MAHKNLVAGRSGRRKREDSADAFLRDPEGGRASTSDEVAEGMAEDFLRSATSGEEVWDERGDEPLPEEIEGLFVADTGDEDEENEEEGESLESLAEANRPRVAEPPSAVHAFARRRVVSPPR